MTGEPVAKGAPRPLAGEGAWSQALAWLIGSALIIAISFVTWLASGLLAGAGHRGA